MYRRRFNSNFRMGDDNYYIINILFLLYEVFGWIGSSVY